MRTLEMEANVNDKHEVKLKLPDNIRNTTVKVIIMYNDSEETLSDKKQRQFGHFKESFYIADDFDNPLPDSFWLGENE